LIADDYEIVIGGSGNSGLFLKSEFPSLKYYELPGVSIQYSKNKRFFISKIVLQLPVFMLNIFKEHKYLKKIHLKEQFDLIISDNRYGVFMRHIPSIFLTHQIHPRIPHSFRFLEKIFYRLHLKYLERFSKIFVPDYKTQPNLSGLLSHHTKFKKVFFIGPQTRLKNEFEQNDSEFKSDILIILSGPEPQRTILEKKLLLQLNEFKTEKIILIKGIANSKDVQVINNIVVYDHLNSVGIARAIHSADFILARSGYSTIMDLCLLKKKALLIPTPGQTEQEYLMHHLQKYSIFCFCEQEELNLKMEINRTLSLDADFSQFKKQNNDDFLKIIAESLKNMI
jgi:uncharacterized protein (TIGR00661 family)